MKVRDSGMPEEAYWESLFQVEETLDRLGIDASLHNVAELGCGYGTFSLAVAARISGIVHTFDIEPAMVRRTLERAEQLGLRNVRASVRDIVLNGFGLPDASQDAALLFNILHAENPKQILKEAARIVRPAGLILVSHWRHDDTTPRGPSLSIRPRPENIFRWATSTGLQKLASDVIELPPYHYGMRFQKLSH